MKGADVVWCWMGFLSFLLLEDCAPSMSWVLGMHAGTAEQEEDEEDGVMSWPWRAYLGSDEGGIAGD